MRLNVSERLSLLSISIDCAKACSFDLTSSKVMADFTNDLGFEQEEIDKLKFSKSGTDWNKSEDKLKEIRVGNRVKEIVKSELEKLDKRGELSFLKHFGLCEKFGYEPQEESKKR